MKQDELFTEMENSKIDLEPKHLKISFSTMPNQLKAFALTKQIICTRVNNNYGCLKAPSRSQIFVVLEIVSSA